MSVQQTVDVILATVIANRLEAITREMGTAMLRSARSPVFAENRDLVTAVFDHRLRMVGQTAYIPVLLGSTPFAVQAVSDYFGDDVHDGDVMILNDPYMGNNHLPDVTVLRPVYFEGRLRFWLLARGHHAEIGGASTAGYNPAARTVWDEGLRITPGKLYRAGEYHRELWTMILSNVRLPFLVEGDLQAQVGATRLGERALQELLERHGTEVVDAAVDETLSRSEAEVRTQIRAIPDGDYHAERQLDTVGVAGVEAPTIRLRVGIRGDTITFDFTGTSPQIPTYHNSTYANTVACCLIAFFSTIDPEIRLNWGSTQPIVVEAPDCTLARAGAGAATSMCTTVSCAAIVEAGWLALAQAVPHLGQAPWARRGIPGMSSGMNPQTGQPFAVIHHFGKGGAGARYGFDGWDHISPVSSMGGSRAPDPELFELRSPHLILNYEYLTDSAGPGEWRGGHGAHYRVRFTSDTVAVVLEPSGVSADTAPAGVCGGLAAPPAEAEIIRADGEAVAVEAPTIYRPQPGDVLEVRSTGGGGHGDPLARPVEAVYADVLDGLLSREKAEWAYGVVIDSETLAIDEPATRARRAGAIPTVNGAGIERARDNS